MSQNLVKENGMEMLIPSYQCHKKVQAFKIHSIKPAPDSMEYILTASDFFGTKLVSTAWMTKHQPEVGGYFVIYEDGYQSYSPAEAFESGYTRI